MLSFDPGCVFSPPKGMEGNDTGGTKADTLYLPDRGRPGEPTLSAPLILTAFDACSSFQTSVQFEV